MRGSSADYSSVEPRPSLFEDEDFKSRRRRTLFLLYAVCFVDGADVQLLPASFRALEANVGFTPTDLGLLAFAQAIFMATFAPVWGAFCDGGVPAKWLLTAGVTSWGFLTIVLSTVENFWGMLVLRAFIGIALASLLPITQALIAGFAGPLERGVFFGWAGAMQLSGQVVCQLVTTTVSNKKFAIGSQEIWGWRIAFFGVGAMSLALAFILAAYMEEVPRRASENARSLESVTDFFTHIKERGRVYMQKWTFCIIVIQGLFGSIPWNALTFNVMYLQYLGYSDYIAAVLSMYFLVAQGFGNLLGGYVGDILSHWSKYHGRPLTGQITVFNGIPLVLIILRFLPKDNNHFHLYASMLFLLGLMASWALAGVKRPMLSQIIGSRDWASMLALDTALEGASAAMFGAPVVGWLTQNVFGYNEVQGQIKDMPEDVRRKNMESLGVAMFWTTVIPWMICFCLWSLLHWTYPRDAKENEDSEGAEAAGETAVTMGRPSSEANPDTEESPLLLKDDGCLAADPA